MPRKALICAVVSVALAIPTASVLAQDPTAGPGRPDPLTEVVPAGAPSAGSQTYSSGGVGRRGGKGAKGADKLLTGFGDFQYVNGDDALRRQLMDETVGMNGSVVRLYVSWRSVAPSSLTPRFDPKDPGSDQYDWTKVDAAVRNAKERNLRPILLINSAPDWAEGRNRNARAQPGTWKPSPGDLADFASAIAKRYSGSFESLPRVRDFMAWNEPNLPLFLTPQYKGGKLQSGERYRRMLNAFYDAVHAVNGRNRVITGGTAPYGGGLFLGDRQTRPLAFWRDVLCVKGRGKKARGAKCPDKPKFDVLAHHPVNTSGGPTTSAISPDDVSTPDVHNLVDVLRVAERAHNVKPGGKRPVWATEIWWESNPPDPTPGFPSLATQAKWYQLSLYLLWKQGVSMVLFYQVRDDPYSGPPGRGPGSSYDTGTYFADGDAKPSAHAVRFPFVVQRSKGKELLWGIAPESGRLAVTQSGRGPRKVVKVKVKAGRVFTKRVKLGKGKHRLRAKIGGEKSLDWKLK